MIDEARTKEDLARHDANIAALEDQLDAAEAARAVTLAIIWKAAHGVSVGCKVKDSKGSVYLVTALREGYSDEMPRLRGRKITANGSPGQLDRDIWRDWSVVKS